ncbi:metal-dependent hydrolase [Planctomicrobium sp. SH661]|uniref:metal-dependent hydrolase n=1 Tax=Planctomicrobium sp. SH661 TaxID=3448124 RepID=UPI003F5CB592
MAAFRQHILFSSLLGVGYGVAAGTLLKFSPTEAMLAGYLTGVGGMLPDLDIPTGRPGQEIFSLSAAVVPLITVGHILKVTQMPVNNESMILVMLCMYFFIRYGLAWLVNKLSVHRGMFHSLPAMLIAGESMYLVYPSPNPWIKLLMGGGLALGFFSHLFLDEIYSVGWNGPLPQIKKSFGTAIKWASPSLGPTLFTYALLVALTFVAGEQAGIIGLPQDPEAAPFAGQEEEPAPKRETTTPPVVQSAAVPEDQLTDAPLFQ